MKNQFRLVTNYVNENSLVRHHLDSFNTFCDTTIKQIVRNHSIVALKTNKLQISFENISVKSPSIPTESNRPLTPQECRLRKSTYSAPIFAKIRIKSQQLNIIQEVLIGQLPIMLRSSRCVLSNASINEQFSYGEDFYDPGGYFITNGTERVVLMYEQTAANRVIIVQRNGILAAGVASNSRERKSKIEVILNNKMLSCQSSVFGKKPVNLVIVMRAMGVESDQEIMQLIGVDSLFQEYLQQTIFEAQELLIFTQKQALIYIFKHSEKTARKSPIIDVLEALAINFICHINVNVENIGYSNTGFDAKKQVQTESKFAINGQQKIEKEVKVENQLRQEYNFKPKLVFLAEMVRRIILCKAGVQLPTDRDFYGNKRIELAGQLFELIFEDSFRNMTQQLSKRIDDFYKKGREIDPKRIIEFIDSKKITISFSQAISSGNVTLDRFKYTRVGSSQVVARLSYISCLGQMTRLTSTFDKDLKATGPRMLNTSQYGICCPSDTPEGESVGLVKNLAALAEISTDQDINILQRVLNALGLEDINFIDFSSSKLTQINLNGEVVGIHSHPEFLIQQLRKLRRMGKISQMTSVAYDSLSQCVNVCCDSGRACRPLIVVDQKTNQVKITQNDIDQVVNGELSVKDLIKTGKIELIDVSEAANCDIGFYISDLKFKKCTHIEIDCLAVYGVVASLVPFPHHNQSPRNVFQCAMGKQAIGMPCLNIRNRFDTLLFELSYPQKPLVSSKFTRYSTHYMEMPAGQNAIVAVTSFSGYDIEDALIMSRSSVDRGFGRCMVYKCNETDMEGNEQLVGLPENMDQEKHANKMIHTPEFYNDVQTHISHSDPFKQTGEYFKNPDKYRLSQTFKNFHALDSDGLTRLNTKIEDGDILVNKTIGEQHVPATAKFQREAHGVVDKVLIASSPSITGNKTIVKTIIREYRLPYYGDKFSSRHGQKGTVGLIVNQSDMPFSPVTGIVPDMIMNPHGFPSRMTMGKQLELLSGKASVLQGCAADGTIFKNAALSEVCQDLLAHGFNYVGKDLLMSGISGLPCRSYVFEGPIFYQRLKHMVNDKMHARSTGPVSFLTRQPLEGRSKDGGLRLGEMEKDCFIAYGTSALLNERMGYASDEYSAYICKKCGVLGYKGWCQTCQDGTDVRVVKMPYAAKLLSQEMLAMGVLMRFKVD
ncbi:DNA-directed RNA polymerase subunit beta [Spironucleus salmonicida]|uniref:DNA-directed RNA polymerase subunit beta n=1 Tax=Spironucleus salmonicida TaxID=348837 RepID=V6LTW4_9EUKA|nr:DNA-directed RNA polymerase subunit beta [Spironucleus salmonicida]|eukprot:EST48040.1 DNA-directed RNA polymerase subunit B' [Spironucleus salmonicida]